jgi:hypothetical protein
MFKRHAKLAVFLTLSWCAQLAAAGQITLYMHEGMQGREVTLRDAVSNFNEIDFNDRASSIVVSSGRWEVCQHADFRGECRIVEPGDYPSLGSLGDNISSVREVQGRRSGWREEERRGDGPPVTLFDNTDMRGRQLALSGDVFTLAEMNFNDATQSIVIEEGNWEFCVHRDFDGPCRVLGPGQYRNLERVFHRSISSIRQVRERGNGRREREGRREGVALFARSSFGGERLPVRDEVRSLVDYNFNDRAGSLIVFTGQWEFCQHADFRGQCMVYGPGRYDRLGSLDNQITSIRRVR